MSAKAILFAILAVGGTAFLLYWAAVVRREGGRSWMPRWLHVGIGFFTNFFDQLGVGSFATTTSIFKLGKVIDDGAIPGTLNVGHAAPTFAEALISIAIIDVDMTTLASMIAASVLGAWLGAGVVARWPRQRIQVGMGVLLLVGGTIMVLKLRGLVPGGGEALGLRGTLLGIGIGVNFVLGALMTLGIGLFAPCMILVALLGMNAKVAYPIMMGSCAFLMPAASVRFIREGRYDLRAALGLTAGGVPAVLIAAYIVKELPVRAVQWLVVGVVVYTALAMLRSARREARKEAGPHAA